MGADAKLPTGSIDDAKQEQKRGFEPPKRGCPMTEPLANDEPNYGAAEQPVHAPLEPLVLSPALVGGKLPTTKKNSRKVVLLKRGHPIAAWLVIGFLVLLVPTLLLFAIVHSKMPLIALDAPGRCARPARPTGSALLVITMQSKFFVGLKRTTARPATPMLGKSMIDQAGSAPIPGPLENRLCFAVLAGELEDSQAARTNPQGVDRENRRLRTHPKRRCSPREGLPWSGSTGDYAGGMLERTVRSGQRIAPICMPRWDGLLTWRSPPRRRAELRGPSSFDWLRANRLHRFQSWRL